MKISFHDLETFSTVPINAGTWKYAEGAEVLLWAYAMGDETPKVWDVASGAPMPDDLADMLADPEVVTCWHNGAMFDTVVLKLTLGIDLPLVRVHDTLVQALCHSLPGSLGALCEVLGIAADKAKDKAGKALINLFCKPIPFKFRKRAEGEKLADYKAAKEAGAKDWPGRATAETHPAEWQQFISYASSDILAMREIYAKLPKWNYRDFELSLWHLDQRINRRGMCMDVELAQCAVNAVDAAQAGLRERTVQLTAGEVESATKRDAMLVHILAEYGVDLPDMQKATLERRIADPELSEVLRELLRVRLQATTTSTSKYTALLRSVSSDGRLRGTKQFCGAGRTGRWAGRLFQPDNLPRPSLSHAAIQAGIEALKGGYADLLFDNIMELTSSAIRGCIVAPEGKKLVVADLSNIEGRVLAWLAGESWKVRAFREYDRGEGHDLYALAYAKSFGVTPESVMEDKKKGGNQRQIGKVQELACLGPETLVLTDKLGYIPILDVTTELKVWDGEQWVQHQGLVARGEKETINVAGLEVTPDHLMLIERTWTPAQQLASCESILCQALATASASLPLSATTSGPLEAPARSSRFNVRAVLNRIRCMTTTYAKALARAAKSAHAPRPAIGVKTFGLMPISCRPTIIAGDCSAAYPPASIDVTTQMIGVTKITADAAFMYTQNGAKIDGLSWRTWSPWMAGTKRLWSWIVLKWTRATSRETFDSSRTNKIRATDEKSAPCKTLFCGLKKRMQTYDLLCAGPRNRFTILSDRGPLIAHNCGYEGGVGGFLTFAAAYGIDLEALAENALRRIPGDVIGRARIMLEWFQKKGRDPLKLTGLSERAWLVCESFVLGWRDAHPNIRALWKDLDASVREAISNPGITIRCGMLRIRRDGAWLRIVLPSGRALCYPSPKLEPEKKKRKPTEQDIDHEAEEVEATGKTVITYAGMNQYSRKWDRISTYGGKLVENVVQAIARDVMAANMPAIEEAGYEIILTVHDEVLTEAPDHPDWNPEHLAAIMARVPDWAEGLPLAAAGFEDVRYRKD